MENVLEVKNISKAFTVNKKLIQAVDDVSFVLKKGECLGIVGESGCGKSTIARIVTLLLRPDSGCVVLNGREIQNLSGAKQRKVYKQLQMVFQNPNDSFDPGRTLGDGIMESIINDGMKKSAAQERMRTVLKMVGLDEEIADRYPHQVSGGQCQRAAIARSIIIKPSVLICDEATSALDVTIQMQIIELLKKLQQQLGLSIILICHDLAVVQNMCERVNVMYDGRIIEAGMTEDIIKNPQSDYTCKLVDSVL